MVSIDGSNCKRYCPLAGAEGYYRSALFAILLTDKKGGTFQELLIANLEL